MPERRAGPHRNARTNKQLREDRQNREGYQIICLSEADVNQIGERTEKKHDIYVSCYF